MRVKENFKKISGLNYKNGEFVKTDYVGDAVFIYLKNDDDVEAYNQVAEDLGVETIGLNKPGHYMWVDNVCDGWVNLVELLDFVQEAIKALDESAPNDYDDEDEA